MPIIRPRPLTKEAFAPYGDVIETTGSDHFLINNGNTQRYHRLASVDLAEQGDKAIINIFRAQPLTMPLRISMMERHPKGSQAFIPLKQNTFLVLVAPAGLPPEPEHLAAFTANGTQGINYRQGVWHHPILCCTEDDDFLVIDRDGAGNNCDEHYFSEDIEIYLNPNNASK
ncbi:MAG: ureidoglycolate lyase [Oceanospirillaceae bacterium]